MRKGQKACYVAFYKEIKIESAGHGEDERTSRLFARGDPLFNADQVDGLQEASISAPVEELPDVDGFIARRWTWIIHGGNRACLIPKLDEIHMPPAKRSPAPAARVSPTWDQVLEATPVRTTASRHPPSAPSFLSRAAGANVFRSWHCLSLSGYRGRQAPQSRLDGCDILLDLGDRRAAVKACRRLEVYRKPPAVHPQILKRLAVFQTGIAFNNQFNRTRHNTTPRNCTIQYGQPRWDGHGS